MWKGQAISFTFQQKETAARSFVQHNLISHVLNECHNIAQNVWRYNLLSLYLNKTANKSQWNSENSCFSIFRGRLIVLVSFSITIYQNQLTLVHGLLLVQLGNSVEKITAPQAAATYLISRRGSVELCKHDIGKVASRHTITILLIPTLIVTVIKNKTSKSLQINYIHLLGHINYYFSLYFLWHISTQIKV